MLVGLMASYFMPYSSGRFKSYAIRDLRNKAVEHVDKLQVSVKDTMHTGDITARLNNDLSMIEIFIGSLSNTLYMLLVIIVTFVYLFSIEWRLLVLSFISIPIALIVSNKLSEPIGKLHAQYYDYFAQSNNLMHDAINGIAVLKAYNLEEVFQIKVSEKQTKALEIYDNEINVRSNLLMPIMFMVYELPYVLCSIYGGYLAVNGKLLASSLVAFILLLRYLVGPTSQLPKMLMDIKSAIGAGSRVFELFELPTERMDGTSYEMNHDECAVEFDNVTFSYIKNKVVLKYLSFKIKSGTSVALVGISGCGKSTIINLICGFYKANSGTIHIYGNDTKNCNLFSLREQLAFVSQDTYLYTGTIEENIRLGRQNATYEEIIAAAKQANAHHFIINLDNGYDTQVGERGCQLSGGQKQRIAIARAILKDASILLFDEPTSALDTQSEGLIQQSIKQLSQKKTVLTVAHRLSTIKQADLILVIEDGNIVESGTHDELLLKAGLYKRLYINDFLKQDREGA
jgi:ABC-type multidrug transport system fused ATPase/permease subunit